MPDIFDQILAADSAAKQKWDETAARFKALAKGSLNLDLDDADLRNVPELRLSITAGDAFGEVDWNRALAECQNLDRAKQQIAAQKKAEAICAGDAESVAALNSLSREKRISEARRLGLDKATNATPESSILDPDIALRRVLSLKTGQDRLNAARKYGLV